MPRTGLSASPLLVLVLLTACGGRPKPGPNAPPTIPSTVAVGACADPATDGVVGARPDMMHADRDLDGDRVDEVIVADRGACSGDDNCHWNVFRHEEGCHRYLGTVAGAKIQRLVVRGQDGFVGLRTYWRFAGGKRFLMQEYRYRRGGYQVVEAMLCRQADDDRLECAER